MLALKNKHIDGIKLDLYLTKDNVLIAIDDIGLTRLGINQKYVNEHSFKHLRKLNLGTKVKKNFILSLNEITSFIPPKKVIIANVIPPFNKLDIIVDKIVQTTKKNSNINWFITSNYKFVLDELLKVPDRNFKIGKFIIEEYDLNFSFEFYLIRKSQLDNINMKEKIKLLNMVFITNITSKYEVEKNYEKNFHFVSKNINKIYKN